MLENDTGREWDTETSLYYYRARYYDPAAGRFVSEDPLSFRGGLNKYAYVSNSSVDFRDPRGLCKESPLSCAGTISQMLSLNAISPVRIPLLGSNFFGDVATAVSPGPLDERADAFGSAAAEVGLHAAAKAGPHIAIGSVPSIGLPVSATSGIYNPITLSESTATFGGAFPEIAFGLEFALGVGELKLAADAVVFLAAFGYCAFH
jgi:RHS repeat-associated protein